MNRGSGLAQYWAYTRACATPSHIDWPDGRSEIRIGASRGIVMLQSRSIPIEANHYINILYYFLYLTLSSSTLRDTFPTGTYTPCFQSNMNGVCPERGAWTGILGLGDT